ncbi:MAG: DNA translocase FtsK 4TM domain-containing protein [Pseudomonadota bacterium]
MADKRQKKENSNRQARFINRQSDSDAATSNIIYPRIKEGILVLIAAISLYLLLALLSYHYTDSSWVNTGNGIIANLGGRVGATIAAILLSLFGYPAYLLPLLLVVLVWEIYRRQEADHSRQERILHMVLSLLGFMIVLLAICGMSDILLQPRLNLLPMGSGGIIGYGIAKSLVNVFNDFGSILFLLAIFLFGFTLFSGISWAHVSKLLFKGLVRTFVYLRQRNIDRINRLQEEKATQAQAKVDIRQQPKLIKPVAAPPEPVPSMTPTIIHQKVANKIKNNVPYKGGLPPIELLDKAQPVQHNYQSNEKLEAMSENLERHLEHFNINAKVVGVEPGPVVTRFEVDLAPGMKVSKVTNIDKDLARSMSTASVRVVEVIQGKSYIGIEIPNESRDIVNLRELLSASAYQKSHSPLTLALGKNISGHPVIMDLQKMPHLLVAGTTGSGKSVSLNAMILGMLFKSTPKELRMIMIDPKMLELSIYKDIPHLLAPVVTDMKEAANALRWCIAEMERRYRLMAKIGVRNLASLNHKIETAIKAGKPLEDPLVLPDQPTVTLENLPSIVVIIDELADMMMVVGKKVEQLIARIAQKARAAGIHMILATQRPSVDVITGLIKANIPCRIAFSVSSRVDSRTILDQQGAHQLLGYGDMLFLPPGTSVPMRVHAPFVSDDEIHRVVNALRENGAPQYIDAILSETDNQDNLLPGESSNTDEDGEKDALYDQAVAIVLETKRASISLVQRRLRIGYNRAANILEAMEAAGLVSPMQNNGSREVIIPGENP